MKTNTNTNTNTDTCTVTIAVRDLRQTLTGLGKVMGKHPPGSALGCVQVVADGTGDALLGATDGETSANVRLAGVASRGQAEFLVPAARLRELIKPAKPSDTVTLSPSGDGDGAEVSTGTRSRTIASPPPSAFPREPIFEGKARPLPAGAIRAIGEALRCASTDKTRRVLNGIHLDTSGKGHHVVGTDGRHLFSANSFTLPVSGSVILASNRLLDWKPIKEAEEWTLRLARDNRGGGGSYEITAGAWRIIGQLVDGNYPSWRQVIPPERDFKGHVHCAPGSLAELAQTLAKLPVATTGGHHRPVVVRSDGEHAELLWKEAADEPFQSIPIAGATTSGKPFTISIDRPYLAKAFAFGFGEMGVKDEVGPARFSDGDGRQMIVMPLRTTDGLKAQRPTTPRTPPPARQRNEPEPEPTTDTPKMQNREPQRKTPATAAADTAAPIDAAIAELAKVRETLRDAASGLSAAAAKMKTVKQEQRTADREIRSVRSTIESLRKVRL